MGRRQLAILVIADSLWVSLMVVVAVAIDCWRHSAPWPGLGLELLAQVGVGVTIWLMALYTCGAYERRYLLLKGRNLSLTVCGTMVGAAVTAGACYLAPEGPMSRYAFLALVFLGGAGLVGLRGLWLQRQPCPPQPTFLGLGDATTLGEIWVEFVRTSCASGLLPVVRSEAEAEEPCPPGVVSCSAEAALATLTAEREQVVVLTDGTIPSPQAAEILGQASLSGGMVADVASFYELFAGRAPIFRTSRGWLLHVQHQAPSAMAYLAKRLFDIAICLALVPLAAPLVAVCAVAIKLTSPGPVLYRQRRVGMRGQQFYLVKLRSMRVDAEAGTGAVWAQQADSRTTPLGRVMRALGLDELPQLWNVLRGDMSLVGPRPERPEVVATLARELAPYLQRLAVPAGITGWAQVHRGSDTSVEDVLDKVRLDLYYARNFSLWFDVVILLRTFQMLLARAKPAPARLVGSEEAAEANAEGPLATVAAPRRAPSLVAGQEVRRH
jgi:exopolysaccharide biosynthesis polyprenyl glycosylphosphotransferase